MNHFPATSPPSGGSVGDAIYGHNVNNITLYNPFPSPKRKNKSKLTGVKVFSWTRMEMGDCYD